MNSKLYKLALWYIKKCNAKCANQYKEKVESLTRLTYRTHDKYLLLYGADAEWQNFNKYDVLNNAIQRLGEYENIGTVEVFKALKKGSLCRKEWMIHVWGGAWNSDANPSIEKDYGIHEGYHYFNTEEEKDRFLEIINKPEYRNQGLMSDTKYGFMTHKRTIFVGTFKYEDKEFVLHYDLGYEYEEDAGIFYFTKGNFSCDCNRSLAIRREYGDDAIPQLGCGEDIELVDYHIEYLD